MSQEVQVKWSKTKEGGMHMLISRYGRHIYLNEEETRKVRYELTKALRKFKEKK